MSRAKSIGGELVGLRTLLQQKREARALLDEEILNISKALVHLERGLNPESRGNLAPETVGIIEGTEQVFAANDDRPMTVRTLTQLLMQLGVETKSKRFSGAVYATLWNSPKFVRLADGTWVRRSAAPAGEAAAWVAIQEGRKKNGTPVKKKSKRRGR